MVKPRSSAAGVACARSPAAKARHSPTTAEPLTTHEWIELNLKNRTIVPPECSECRAWDGYLQLVGGRKIGRLAVANLPGAPASLSMRRRGMHLFLLLRLGLRFNRWLVAHTMVVLFQPLLLAHERRGIFPDFLTNSRIFRKKTFQRLVVPQVVLVLHERRISLQIL